MEKIDEIFESIFTMAQRFFYLLITRSIYLAFIFSFLYFYFPNQFEFLFSKPTHFYFWITVLLGYCLASCFLLYRRAMIIGTLEEDVEHVKNKYSTIIERKRAFNYAYLENEKNLQLQKMKLEILKSFSPIPIILFVLAFFQEHYANIYNLYNDFDLSFVLLTENLFILFSLSCFLGYIAYLITIWGRYKMFTQRKYKYFIELENVQSREEEAMNFNKYNRGGDFTSQELYKDKLK